MLISNQISFICITQSLTKTFFFISKRKLVQKLQQNLKIQAMKVCGKEDRFRGNKISIAPLQITATFRDMEKLNQTGHFHRRQDIVDIFLENDTETIAYEQIFIEAKRKARKSSISCTNEEAKVQHIERHGNLVFISGQAGIGKSTLMKLIVQQMLDPQICLFQAEFVFFLQFRDLDYQDKMDLLQFLTTSARFTSNISVEDKKKIFQHLELNENVCIVMDGFDEATIDLNVKYPNCNAISNTTAAVFIRNLFSGHILPKSKKLVTSRPRQLGRLPDEYSSNLFLNLLGLSYEGQCQICRELCRDNPTRRDRILVELNNRPDLKSLCYVPINCIMVMMSFYALNSFEQSNIATLTAILVNTMEKWFLKKLHGKFQTKEISSLAYNGFLIGKFSFKEFDLRKAKINSENTTAFFTNNIKFQLLQGKAVTYFCHLMWQEFFVAVKLRLYAGKKKIERFLNLAKRNDKYEVVTRFLFGLCNKYVMDELLEHVEIQDLKSRAVREKCKEMLKSFVMSELLKLCRTKDESKQDDSNVSDNSFYGVDNTKLGDYIDLILPLLGWIYEMKDEEFTKQAAKCLENEISISQTNHILPGDVPSINHVLRYRDTELTLQVNKPIFVGNCFKYFFKELQETVDQNPNIKVRMYHSKLYWECSYD